MKSGHRNQARARSEPARARRQWGESIEPADPHCERQVVRLPVGIEREVFAGNRANAQHSVLDEIAGIEELSGGFRRPVDSQDVPSW